MDFEWRLVLKKMIKFGVIFIIMIIMAFSNTVSSDVFYAVARTYIWFFNFEILFEHGMYHTCKKEIKGIIQYDRKNFDVPAMRILFSENPLNCMNSKEVTFKVDINADLSELDESK